MRVFLVVLSSLLMACSSISSCSESVGPLMFDPDTDVGSCQPLFKDDHLEDLCGLKASITCEVN